MSQAKEEQKPPIKQLKEIDESKANPIPDAQFKLIIIRMLRILKKNG